MAICFHPSVDPPNIVHCICGMDLQAAMIILNLELIFNDNVKGVISLGM